MVVFDTIYTSAYDVFAIAAYEVVVALVAVERRRGNHDALLSVQSAEWPVSLG